MPTGSVVDVKWFVPINGVRHVFPAKVLSPFHVTCSDPFRAELEKHLKEQFNLGSDLSNQMLEKYDKDPIEFREALRGKLEEYVNKPDRRRFCRSRLFFTRFELQIWYFFQFRNSTWLILSIIEKNSNALQFLNFKIYFYF